MEHVPSTRYFETPYLLTYLLTRLNQDGTKGVDILPK